MTQELVVNLGREALLAVLLTAGPILGLGMLTGLIISVIQATTQINEQTLTFVPKIVVVLLSVVFFGPWMLTILVDFTRRLFESIPLYVR